MLSGWKGFPKVTLLYLEVGGTRNRDPVKGIPVIGVT